MHEEASCRFPQICGGALNSKLSIKSRGENSFPGGGGGSNNRRNVLNSENLLLMGLIPVLFAGT
jgi:hypothetical protein